MKRLEWLLLKEMFTWFAGPIKLCKEAIDSLANFKKTKDIEGLVALENDWVTLHNNMPGVPGKFLDFDKMKNMDRMVHI